MTYVNIAKQPQNQIISEYQKLRERINELEKIIDNIKNEKTAKRLDKAVTVLKVGAKLVKKALKDEGFVLEKPLYKTEEKNTIN